MNLLSKLEGKPCLRGATNGRKSPVKRMLFVPVSVALLVLSGCAAKRLRLDYSGYENSYAESSNHQLLLNLARLNQHHPTYFFKLGPISTTYRMQGTLAGNASQAAGLYNNPLN